jgi:hypothetical protein
MPISENLINSTGTFSAWAGGGITSGTNGMTTTSSNSWARSSASMDNSDNAFDIEFVVKWGGHVNVGVSDGRSWGTWGGAWVGRLYTTYIDICMIGGSTYDAKTHGLTEGDVATVRFQYASGTINLYLNDTLKCTHSVDLSSYTTMYPVIWVDNNDDFIQSYKENTDSTSVTITPDALTATSVINDVTISTVRNITTILSVQSLTSSVPTPTINTTINTTVTLNELTLTSSQPNCTVYPLAETTTASSVIYMANRDRIAIKLNDSGTVYLELD